MNKRLREAEALLLEHRQALEHAIEEWMPSAGSGVIRRGSYPIFVYSAPGGAGEDAVSSATPFQLQMTVSNGTARFTRGRVQAGSHVVIPTIDGLDVDDEDASLPLLTGGGQVFARYTYTLNPATVPYDWTDVFVECELVQVALDAVPPSTVFVEIGNMAGVSPAEGTAYTLLMCYAAGGTILHYGQSLLLEPDPDDEFPTQAVVFVAPQVSHVA